jgi:hypothetical protein
MELKNRICNSSFILNQAEPLFSALFQKFRFIRTLDILPGLEGLGFPNQALQLL